MSKLFEINPIKDKGVVVLYMQTRPDALQELQQLTDGDGNTIYRVNGSFYSSLDEAWTELGKIVAADVLTLEMVVQQG